MVRRPAGRLRIDPFKSNRAKIELVDKDVDDPNRIVLVNPVLQALGKQRALPSVRPLNEALHAILRKIMRESYGPNHLRRSVFTQPGPFSDRHGWLRRMSNEGKAQSAELQFYNKSIF